MVVVTCGGEGSKRGVHINEFDAGLAGPLSVNIKEA